MKEIFYSNLSWPKTDIQSITRCYQGGGSSNSSSSQPQLDPQQMMALYQQAIPSTLGTINQQAAPAANALAGAAASANPTYTASGLAQLQGYAPGYQQQGANLALSQAGSTNQLLTGAGGQAATSAVNLNNTLNPVQAQSNAQAGNLLGSINLNGLSGGEQNAVQRSLNQSNYATGNLGLDNATNAVSNAMNFGGAFNSKLGILGSALGAAGGVASNQNAQVNPVTTAFGAGSTANNFGLSTFNPTQANSTLTTPSSTATSLGNQIAGVSAAQRSGSNGASASGGICYLTTACCEYRGLEDDCEELQVLRKFRDEYVPKELVKEYYSLAHILIPKIRENIEALRYIWEVVKLCVSQIKMGHKECALQMYKDMVTTLKELK